MGLEQVTLNEEIVPTLVIKHLKQQIRDLKVRSDICHVRIIVKV